MIEVNLKYKVNLTAEEAALVALGIYDRESIEEARAVYFDETVKACEIIYRALLKDSPLVVRQIREHRFDLTSLCLHDDHSYSNLKYEDFVFTRNSLAKWFASSGNFVAACRIDPLSAQRSPSFPDKYLAEAARSAKKLCESHIDPLLGTRLMRIAQEIYDDLYVNLKSGDVQPEKEVVRATLRERHPSLSDKEIESVYVVTRRYKDERVIP